MPARLSALLKLSRQVMRRKHMCSSHEHARLTLGTGLTTIDSATPVVSSRGMRAGTLLTTRSRSAAPSSRTRRTYERMWLLGPCCLEIALDAWVLTVSPITGIVEAHKCHCLAGCTCSRRLSLLLNMVSVVCHFGRSCKSVYSG